MKTLKTILLATSAAVAMGACASTKSCKMSDDSCSTKSCGVPTNILAAARAKVPGFAMTSYDCDSDNGCKVYSLDGTANGRKCEVKVDANGKVLKIDRD